MRKTTKQLMELDQREMEARVGEIDREMFSLRNQLAIERKWEKPHLLKAKKKEKARLLTFLTQREQKGSV